MFFFFFLQLNVKKRRRIRGIRMVGKKGFWGATKFGGYATRINQRVEYVKKTLDNWTDQQASAYVVNIYYYQHYLFYFFTLGIKLKDTHTHTYRFKKNRLTM